MTILFRLFTVAVVVTGALIFVLPGTSTPASAAGPWDGTPQKAFLDGPIVRKFQCVTCHTITDQGGTVGPILNLVGLRRSEDWIRRWLQDPNEVKPGTKMPKFPFSAEEFELAVSFLTGLTKDLETDNILAGSDSDVARGEKLFEDYDCYACHRIGDRGRFVGPDLTWVGTRKRETWERIWLADPSGFKPDTFMPDFHIPAQGVQSLAAFLHTLQGQYNDNSRDAEFMVNMLINNNDVRRGELVFRRLACWSCHGETGDGGVKNPNTLAEHSEIPGLTEVRDNYSAEEFLAKVEQGSEVSAADPAVEPGPFACPPYRDALNELEAADLYAYVSSLAPPVSRWTIK